MPSDQPLSNPTVESPNLVTKTPGAVEIKPFKGTLEGPQFGKQNLSDVAQDLQEVVEPSDEGRPANSAR